tara:strand:- start:217 stop:534 length:318 start_codon:yes stop_codon:yes gene_type:complete
MKFESLKKNILLYGLIIIILLSLVLGNNKLYEGNTNQCCPPITNCSLEHANSNSSVAGQQGFNNCVANNRQLEQNCFNSCPMGDIDDTSWRSMTCCPDGANIELV